MGIIFWSYSCVVIQILSGFIRAVKIDGSFFVQRLVCDKLFYMSKYCYYYVCPFDKKLKTVDREIVLMSIRDRISSIRYDPILIGSSGEQKLYYIISGKYCVEIYHTPGEAYEGYLNSMILRK